MATLPSGAKVYVDGHRPATVRACFPVGSTSLASPHYVVDFVDGDTHVKVSMARVGVDAAPPLPKFEPFT